MCTRRHLTIQIQIILVFPFHRDVLQKYKSNLLLPREGMHGLRAFSVGNDPMQWDAQNFLSESRGRLSRRSFFLQIVAVVLCRNLCTMALRSRLCLAPNRDCISQTLWFRSSAKGFGMLKSVQGDIWTLRDFEVPIVNDIVEEIEEFIGKLPYNFARFLALFMCYRQHLLNKVNELLYSSKIIKKSSRKISTDFHRTYKCGTSLAFWTISRAFSNPNSVHRKFEKT